MRRPVLVTTRVTYFMPLAPLLLNEFVWQHDDLDPELPRVRQFLDHWRREVRAVIARVDVATSLERGWRALDYVL